MIVSLFAYCSFFAHSSPDGTRKHSRLPLKKPNIIVSSQK